VTHQLDRKGAPRIERVRVGDAKNAGGVTCASDTPLGDAACQRAPGRHPLGARRGCGARLAQRRLIP
jgi:hypothetical protein